MAEIIYNLLDLVKTFINGIFDFKIEFFKGQQVSIGIIVLAFLFIVISFYLVSKAIGIKKEDDN